MKKIFLIGLCVFILLSFSSTFVCAETAQTLTLTENWTLTEDIDLKVPDGITLIINGFDDKDTIDETDDTISYIYEMGGKLTNTGAGKVIFENTILYTLDNDIDAGNVYTDVEWGPDESGRLLLERAGIHSDEKLEYKYNVIKEETKYKYEISMTSTENVSGTFIVALYDDNARLVGVDTSVMEGGTVHIIEPTEIQTTGTAAIYKIMFWSGFDSLKPICGVVKGNVIMK